MRQRATDALLTLIEQGQASDSVIEAFTKLVEEQEFQKQLIALQETLTKLTTEISLRVKRLEDIMELVKVKTGVRSS